MGWNEWNKGYFSSGPQSSHDAQQGQAAKERDDRARAERESSKPPLYFPPTAGEISHEQVSTPSHSGAPATFASTVKNMAIVGCLIGLAYGYFGLQLGSWAGLGLWAIKGVFVGGAAGIVLYLVIAVLRIVFAILAVILTIVLWVALAFGALHLLSKLF